MSVLSAQDVIQKRSGKKIKCTVVEMGSTEVKYIQWGDPNEVIFTIDRALIRDIKFSYGGKHTEEPPEVDEYYFEDDRANSIELDFIALSANALILTYERALSPGTAIEGSVKLLGLGVQNEFIDRSGVGIDLGYKLKFGSLFKGNDYRPRHLMSGGYLRPSLGWTRAVYGDGRFNGDIESYSQINLGLTVGKQWALQNAAVLDLYLGLHYYAGSFDYSGMSDFFRGDIVEEGNLFGSNGTAIGFGLRVGGLFSKYKPRDSKSKGRERR